MFSRLPDWSPALRTIRRYSTEPAMPRTPKPAPKSSTPKSEETRARILAAALRTFRQHGFEAATMRQVAAEAGVALGAAYHYFDSKDAIVMAFDQQAQSEIAPDLDGPLSGSRTLEQRLRGIIGQKIEYFAPNRSLSARFPRTSTGTCALALRQRYGAHPRSRPRLLCPRRRRLETPPAVVDPAVLAAPALALPDGRSALLGLRSLASAATDPGPFR